MGKLTEYGTGQKKTGGYYDYMQRNGLSLPGSAPTEEQSLRFEINSPLIEMTALLDEYDKENYNEAFSIALLGAEDAEALSQSIASYQQGIRKQLSETTDLDQREQLNHALYEWDDLMARVLKQRALSSQKMQQYENFAEFRQSENWYLDEKIARIAQQAQSGDNSNSWFKGSNLFSDGYQFGDVAKTIGATALDVGQETVEGAGRFVERLIDAAVYAGGAAYGAFGNEEAKIGAQTYIEHSLDWDKIGRTVIPDPVGSVDGDSVLGAKSDGIANFLGEQAVKWGMNKLLPGSVLTFTGVSAFGAEAENALRQGASYSKAGASALISAGGEVLSSILFGGNSLEGKGLFNTEALTKNMSAGLLKTALDYGIDFAGEGLEGVFSQFVSNFGSALYREENLSEILFSKEAWQGYLDSFVSEGVASGLFNFGKALGTLPTKTKGWTDYRTGLTADQQKQFNQEYKARIAHATSDGTRLSSKARSAIYDATLANVKSGNPLVFSPATTPVGTGVPDGPNTSPVGTGVPDGPNPTAAPSVVNAAIAAVREGGTVTNAMATTIVDDPAAVSYLTEQTGMELPDTMSGKRNAVKQAIAKLADAPANVGAGVPDGPNTSSVGAGVPDGPNAPTSPIDTAPKSGYDNQNTTGGNLYGDQQNPSRSLYPDRIQWNAASDPQGETAGGGANGRRYESPGHKGGAYPGTGGAAVHPADSEGRSLTPEQQSAPHGIRYYASKVNQAILQLVDRVKKGSFKANEKVDLGVVTDEVANRIHELTGIDVSGYRIAIEARQIEHILKDHGENGKANRSMADPEDIARIEYALSAPDSISKAGTTTAYVTNKDGKMKPAETVLYEKLLEDGSYYVAQAVPETQKRTLYIVTAFIGKSGYKRGATQSANANSPGATPEAESASTPVISIPPNGEIVNPTVGAAPPEGGVPGGGVGPAPGWFDLNTRLQYEYGTIPEGENPVRPADLPKKDYTGKDVSKTAATAKGAKVTPDEFVDLLNKETVEGNLSYIRISNSDTVQEATEFIKEQGWELAKGIWENEVVDGKAGAKMSAIGALLLNNAAKAGDRNAWLDILYHYQMLGTNTAQGLQALRILKTLEPSDKLYMIKRAVKQMSKETGLDLTLDPELVNEFDNADTDAARDDVIETIKEDLAAQIPSTFMDGWNALRYVNMLGNLKTQGRNILGNLSMKVLSATKNAIATGLENIAYKVSGGKFERTKSFTVSKELMQAAKDDFAQLQKVIMGGSKLDGSLDQATQFAQDVQNKRRIFGVQGDKWYQKAANAALAPLEGYRKATNWAMEKGDLIFSRSAYARSLAGYLKAHGITDPDLSKVDPKLMDDARLHAMKEAQEVTFRDSNRLADWISKVGRRKDTHPVGKVLAEGAAPFRKTPANVLLRAEEYSPIGFINSIVISARAAGKGSDITGAQVINSWAKSLTGTGMFLLGMLLNNLGILSAGPDENEDKEAAESMNGQQNYALTIPGTDINITIDALSSVAMPLLMGAELEEIRNDSNIELKDMGTALLSIADPMIQMSMLQGVNDILTDIKYTDEPFLRLLETVAVNYLMQGLTNSFLGQLERGTEDVRMTTYTDDNSPLPKWLQYQLGKASAKIPGWDYHQTPYINAKGEEEKNPPTALNLLYNTTSPFYIEKDTSTAMDRELDRLNKAQSDYNVYFRKPSKTLTVDGEEIRLSAQQYDTLCRTQGEHQRRLVEDIMEMDAYKALSDTDKAAVLSKAYDYARDLSKSSVIDGDFTPAYIRNRPEGMSEAEAILRQTVSGTSTKYTDLPIDVAALVAETLKDLPTEGDYKSVRSIQKMEAVAANDDLDPYLELILPAYMEQSQQRKYQEALEEGYTSDQFVAGYRLYLDQDKEQTKMNQIRELAAELGISYQSAKTLWEIYAQRIEQEKG